MTPAHNPTLTMTLARLLKRSVARLDELMTDTGRLEFDRRAWMADEIADRLFREALGQ